MTCTAFGLLSLSSLLTIIDPIAAAPIFLSLTEGRTPQERRVIATRACRVALILLLVFAVAGSSILKIFGITIHAFRIAGGLLFFGTGAGMLGGRSRSGVATDEEADPTIVPIAMPLICGPGALSTVMILMGQAGNAWHAGALLLALLLALVLTWVALLSAPAALRLVGKTGIQVITQVLGLILCVIGVQFVVDGVRPLLLEIL